MIQQVNKPRWSLDKDYTYNVSGSFVADPIPLGEAEGFSIQAYMVSGTASGSFALSGSSEIWFAKGLSDLPSHYVGIVSAGGREARGDFNANTKNVIIDKMPAAFAWVVPVFTAVSGQSQGQMKIIATIKVGNRG